MTDRLANRVHPDYLLTYKNSPEHYRSRAIVTLREVQAILAMPNNGKKMRMKSLAMDVFDDQIRYLLQKIAYLLEIVREDTNCTHASNQAEIDVLKLHSKRWHTFTLRNILNGHTGRSAQAWTWDEKNELSKIVGTDT